MLWAQASRMEKPRTIIETTSRLSPGARRRRWVLLPVHPPTALGGCVACGEKLGGQPTRDGPELNPLSQSGVYLVSIIGVGQRDFGEMMRL